MASAAVSTTATSAASAMGRRGRVMDSPDSVRTGRLHATKGPSHERPVARTVWWSSARPPSGTRPTTAPDRGARRLPSGSRRRARRLRQVGAGRGARRPSRRPGGRGRPAAPVAAPSLLAAALRRGAARAGLSDLAAELRKVADDDPAAAASAIADAVEAGRTERRSLVVDEAQLLNGAAIEALVAALVRRAAGRRAPARRSAAPAAGARRSRRACAMPRSSTPSIWCSRAPRSRRCSQAALGEEAGAAEEAAVVAAAQGWPALAVARRRPPRPRARAPRART